MTNPERKERRREAALKAARTRAAKQATAAAEPEVPELAGDPGSRPRPGHPSRTRDLPLGTRAEGEPSPQGLAVDGPAGPPGRPRSVGGQTMIVRFEQVNARGEGSRPRVDLNALGTLLDRAALGVEMLRMRLRATGEIPGPATLDLEKDRIAALREIRSVRTRSRRRTACTRR